MLGLAGYGDSSDDDASSGPEAESSPQAQQLGASGAAAAQPKPVPHIQVVVKPARDDGTSGPAGTAAGGSPGVGEGAASGGGGVFNATERKLLGGLGVKVPERQPPELSLAELKLKHLGPGGAKAHAEAQKAAGGQGAAEASERLETLEQLQQKVSKTLQKYEEGGEHFCGYMRTNHAFRNPEILTKMVETLGIDKYGSNYPQDTFDPHGYKPSQYIDAIFEQQRAWLTKRNATQRERGSIEFIPGASESRIVQSEPGGGAAAAANGAANNHSGDAGERPAAAVKKSKWSSRPADDATARSREAAAAVAARMSAATAASSTGDPYADFVRLRAAQQANATGFSDGGTGDRDRR